ncbi:MAG: NADH-quinone oxidoreductase subunit NuoG [Chloroflexota bacterium]
MMTKQVTLTIDDQQVTVPAGTLIVDAARRIGKDIPVFCYHPKMEPVGMCRMCLVEVGRPIADRVSGELLREENGALKIQFAPKLETACTIPVTDGMVVRTATPEVESARREVLEFLLTSHPLDCPICDKGGECPLQNLTMGFGPAQSRFLADEKIRLAKHVPLGELIYLDRERCIQCARCVRFQDIIADDPVIGFFNRGRRLQIVTCSEPGFDSIFSGNTSDICPVGALTTADFRFGARPWELKPAASIGAHGRVGCNLTFIGRRVARAAGEWVIKRVMPRQNEQVNEIWICDKGRFAYHYSESNARLTRPLARRGAGWEEIGWEDAFMLAAEKIAASASLVTLAGGRLANEDLFNLRELTAARGGTAALYSQMAGGELTARFGLGTGSNFGSMGKETAILVVASDLHQEAPVWWLRVKQAAQRGAALIVLNPRGTRLDKYAAHSLRYEYGDEAAAIAAFLPGVKAPPAYREAVAAFQAAENTVILYGSEGIGLATSRRLAQTAAAILAARGKTGAPNNGLLAVWQRANDQGAWDCGFRPLDNLAQNLSEAGVALIAAADPAGDDPALAQALDAAGFVIVQELFMTETARLADLVLPVQAFTEREGSLTSGERRLQRYYPALPPRVGTRPDYAVTAGIARVLNLDVEGRAAGLILQRMANALPAYAGMTYQRLAETVDQFPIIGRADLYYGGTAYDNHQGLGVQLNLLPVETTPQAPLPLEGGGTKAGKGELLLAPVTRLYDRGNTVLPSRLLEKRIAPRVVYLNPQTAALFGVAHGEAVRLIGEGWSLVVEAALDDNAPAGIGLAVRSTGIPLMAATAVRLERAVLASQTGKEQA